MHPFVRVHVEETTLAVGGGVAAGRAQHAHATIVHGERSLGVTAEGGKPGDRGKD